MINRFGSDNATPHPAPPARVFSAPLNLHLSSQRIELALFQFCSPSNINSLSLNHKLVTLDKTVILSLRFVQSSGFKRNV